MVQGGRDAQLKFTAEWQNLGNLENKLLRGKMEAFRSNFFLVRFSLLIDWNVILPTYYQYPLLESSKNGMIFD